MDQGVGRCRGRTRRGVEDTVVIDPVEEPGAQFGGHAEVDEALRDARAISRGELRGGGRRML